MGSELAPSALDAEAPWGDPYLATYRDRLRDRARRVDEIEQRLTGGSTSLTDFASGHEHFGLHGTPEGWRFAEWAPNAEALWLVGDFNGWAPEEDFRLQRVDDHGRWEIRLPPPALRHGQHYKLRVRWPGGEGERIPAWARRVVQDLATGVFSAQVWEPPTPYPWRHPPPGHPPRVPLIYEAHVGMAQEHEGVGTYEEFRRQTLPRIAEAGYNTVQLMGILEHPYYGSFGYQVSSFFAPSSRFGTPDEFKALVDEAHGLGLAVLIDLVHSHAVRNEVEGLARFDGTRYQYFHRGERGLHPAWGSLCFDYGKPEVLHFLLSNCRYWLDAYRLDGFRFDGITSMIYHHHGLGQAFTSYESYFDDGVDEDALAYLSLANRVIHALRPDAVTIAEDVSGMPGLAAPADAGGCGFDYRLAMGVPDCWFRLAKDVPDQDWDLGWLWHELTNRRPEERTIGYVESHDQALVGGKSILFEMLDAAVYTRMRAADHHPAVDRGIALHKMMRLATLGTAGPGYLNFMGNEFGHPEWVDFPREGNGWSYRYARRQWSLRDDPGLKYHQLAEFDRAALDRFERGDILGRSGARLLAVHNDDKTLVFERGTQFLFFNFNPARSFVDYPVRVPPGAYDLVLDTDAPEFGGQGRVAPGQRFFTGPSADGAGDPYLRIYLPCRTALVLQRVPVGGEP